MLRVYYTKSAPCYNPSTMSHSRDDLRACQELTLRDEEVGVRHCIHYYYLPLFLDFCRAHRLEPAQVRVLDSGCGNGLSVECLAEAGFSAYGIDNWPVRYDQWRQRPRLPRTGLCAADATRLPFADARFDIVLNSGLLEHIGVREQWEPVYRVDPLPDQAEHRRRFLKECLRVLRRPGVLFIDHPNGAFPIDFWHDEHRALPRFHWPTEKFLPTFKEVAGLARVVDPTCRVEALSPAGRFTFRRTARRWYGRLLAAPVEIWFNLLRYFPFSLLARSPLNPYLVLRITRGN
ncbi:MAG: class I SAM-dependent methyltransferase [Acidobacteria bacterium]|nr:class I SAM-dependent methyltransferase [Acidobacteriota bacterium]